MKKTFRLLCAAMLVGVSARAESTINAVNRFAYGANIGWINWRGDGAHGAVIGAFVCSGKLWSANTGWISLGNGAPANGVRYRNDSATDFGVNHDGAGGLTGYAYSANLGWLTFGNRAADGSLYEGPRVNLGTGRLFGYIWSANGGWISLNNAQAFVQTDTMDCGPDDDGDGLPDQWERQFAANLNGLDGTSDPDGDGASNAEEFAADTSPFNGNSVFRLTQITRPVANSPVALTWTSSVRRQYRIRSSTDVTAPLPWPPFGAGIVSADPGATTTRIVAPDPAPDRFYIIEVLKPLRALPAGIINRTGNLADFLMAIPIPGPDTEAFVAPSSADRAAWRRVIGHFWAGDLAAAAAQAESQGYEVCRFLDTGTESEYFILLEHLANGVPRRGLGTYVYYPAWTRALNIQAPHAFSGDDRNTLAESIAMFLELRAAFLQIAGTSRNANREASPCQTYARIADVAHNTENFFQETSTAVAEACPLLVSISVHGFGAGGANCPPEFFDAPATSLAVIGNGICGDDECPGRGEISNSLATQLAAAMNRLLAATSYPGRGAGSENATANDPRALHAVGCPTPSGNDNTQGLAINGASDPCAGPIWTVPRRERFIHLEQQFVLRRSPGDPANPFAGVHWGIVISAFAEVFSDGL